MNWVRLARYACIPLIIYGAWGISHYFAAMVAGVFAGTLLEDLDND